MITLVPFNDGYYLTCSEEERKVIAQLQRKYPRKLEKHIETFLKERKVNLREQENMIIMRYMSEEERRKRLEEIEGESVKEIANA